MLTYIIRRLLLTIPVLFGITLVTFSFLKLTGAQGGPCAALLGERYTEQRCDEIKERYGLNDSPVVQYQRYMATTLSGDLGRSIVTKRSVASELTRVFPATVELASMAMLLAVVVGIPLGVIAAARHNSMVDLGAMVVALVGVSMPVFWLGLMLVYVLAFKLGLFPTNGRLASGITVQDITGLYVVDSLITGNWPALKSALHHLALPAFALSTIPSAIIARITRSAMLDVLGQDYIRTARAKGLGEGVVIMKHALSNALLPVVTVIGLQTGFLLSGAVLTETIFSWPGMGRWIVQAISSNDTPVVQGGVLIFALVFVMINLVVDISYVWLDPRIRYD
jgi:peptide/nickel transport system permease protein